MSSFKLSEIQQLRLLYREVVEGCTFVPSPPCYIKHLSEVDNIFVLEKRQEFFNQYLSQGLLSEDEQLKICCENEQWDLAKEEQIASLHQIIRDNTKILATIIPQQQEGIRRAIEKNKLDLTLLLFERRQVLGLTADELSEKDSFRFLIYISFFKDKEGKNALFDSWDSFETLEEQEIQVYIDILEKNMAKFSETNLRLISVLPFFINTFSYAKEDISTFLMNPLIKLTNNQLFLFSAGQRNLNVLSQTTGQPPDLAENEPVQKILDWYDQQYSIILGKRNASK